MPLAPPEAMEFRFEELMPYFRCHGTATVYEGQTPADPDDIDESQASRIIQVGQDWFVWAEWRASGWLNNAIDGAWRLQVFLEKMGAGEFQLMPNPLEIPFVSADPHHYFQDVPFPATSMSVPAGLYKIACSLTMVGPPPTRAPLPIAAVGEGPVIQFYEAVGP
jgi:hypothetical protein